MKTKTLQAASALLAALGLHMPAHAQAMPEVSPALKKMLAALPIAEAKDEVQGLVGALRNTPCGGGLSGCYMAKTGPLQLYFFTSKGAQQTFLLVLNKKLALPPLLHANAQKALGGMALTAPMISISTADYALSTAQMPPDLQAVVRDSYFNVGSLQFASGVQLAGRADLGGAFRLTMEALGVRADQLTLRAGVVMPIPTDLVSGGGSGAGLAQAMADGDTMKKAGANAAKPEAFVEFQFAPNARLPIYQIGMALTDATFFMNNELVFGYKGNAAFLGLNSKPILLHFQTPLTPEGGMDLLDFTFHMATPTDFNLQDAANLMVDLASPDPRLAKYGGGFIRNIESIKKRLLAVAKPLSVFQLRNPQVVPEYRFGDASKPFPTDPKYFNVVLDGPLTAGGPQLRLAGEARVMGQTMGAMNLAAGLGGFHGMVEEGLTLKLGPLGRVGITMQASADVTDKTQLIHLKGNYLGRVLELTLNGTQLTIDSPATCLTPFEIKASAEIQDSMNIADILDAQAGANVDPSKLAGCVGADLTKALNWVTSTGAGLGGYAASAAAQQLKDQEKLAAQAYETTKNAARKVANASVNEATQGFKDAGNAISKAFGGKKKHSPKPDPKFAESVFNWDYYYDQISSTDDLVSQWKYSGFDAGRQGSLEFQARYYLSRYSDLQQLCGSKDYACALNHWLWTGIDQGRQGSADFSVLAYLNRYPDLQRSFGPENYADALDHWINTGHDEGRNGQPDSTANGPVAGPINAGGSGGSPWSDAAACNGRYVTGFRVRAGKYVDTLQFRYGASSWGDVHGNNGSAPFLDDVHLASNEYIVRVDYGSGDMLDRVSFTGDLGKTYGPYGGGGGGAATYRVTPGEKLGCMSGRAGASMDRLMLLSTGLR